MKDLLRSVVVICIFSAPFSLFFLIFFFQRIVDARSSRRRWGACPVSIQSISTVLHAASFEFVVFALRNASFVLWTHFIDERGHISPVSCCFLKFCIWSIVNEANVYFGFNFVLFPCHIAATLSEWNVVIYGTKENPDAKNRAAAPALPSGIGIVSNNLSSASAASSAPATTSSSAKLQPNVDKDLSRLNDADRLEGGFINRKPSLHQNLEENRASVFTNPESPVPVLSSASSSAASRCLPTHWDPTAAICLSTSLVSLLLHSDWLWLIWSLWRRISRLRPRPAPTSLSSPSSSAWLAR